MTDNPFDEVQDSASVAKGMALLLQQQAHPERDPARIFADTTPLRSSPRGPKLPYSLIPDPDNKNNSSSSAAADGEEKSSIVDQSSAEGGGGVVLQDGCYLIYDNASGGTLVLHYSHSQIPENVVGFWAPGPGKTIQVFKYAQAGGYVELIRGIVGGEKNKKKYYSGWCQFIQMAKSLSGQVKKFTHFEQGLKVDIYGYHQGRVNKLLDSDDTLQDVSHLEAVAVVPANNDRFQGVRAMPAIAFLEMGNLEGASLHLHI